MPDEMFSKVHHTSARVLFRSLLGHLTFAARNKKGWDWETKPGCFGIKPFTGTENYSIAAIKARYFWTHETNK